MRTQQANLIGKHVTITKAKNKTLEGIKGTVLDETRNTLVIDNKTINGKTIQKQQTERIKVQYK